MVKFMNINYIVYILLTIVFCIVSFYEMNKYKSLKESKLKYLILLSPIFIGVLIKIKGTDSFTLFFSMIIPVLLAQFIIDMKEQELSDLLNLLIAIVGISRLIKFLIFNGWNNIIISYVLCGVIMALLYFILAVITKGSLGGGDIKLIGALGLFFSLQQIALLMIYPMILGSIYGIFLMIFKKANKETMFAFGPAILMAVYIIALL